MQKDGVQQDILGSAKASIVSSLGLWCFTTSHRNPESKTGKIDGWLVKRMRLY